MFVLVSMIGLTLIYSRVLNEIQTLWIFKVQILSKCQQNTRKGESGIVLESFSLWSFVLLPKKCSWLFTSKFGMLQASAREWDLWRKWLVVLHICAPQRNIAVQPSLILLVNVSLLWKYIHVPQIVTVSREPLWIRCIDSKYLLCQGLIFESYNLESSSFMFWPRVRSIVWLIIDQDWLSKEMSSWVADHHCFVSSQHEFRNLN